MIVKNRSYCALLFAGAAFMLCPAANARSIPRVTVNGSPIAFNDASPIEIAGSALVPLRGVFEAMGATVDYNSVSRAITVIKGSENITLTTGSTRALVNGQEKTLSHSAIVVNGSALAPLRFIAQALGGYVEWNEAKNLASITTQDSHLALLPGSPGIGRITGQLTGVYTKTNPEQITLRYNGDNTTIPISNATIVRQSRSGLLGPAMAISDMRIGSQVTVWRSVTGYANSITATDTQRRGTMKSIDRAVDGSLTMKFNDGAMVSLEPDVAANMAGRKIHLSDIQTDERVIVRINPGDGRGYEITLLPAK